MYLCEFNCLNNYLKSMIIINTCEIVVIQLIRLTIYNILFFLIKEKHILCTIVGVEEVENNRIMFIAELDDDSQILYCERNRLSRKCSNDDVSATNELLPFMLQCIIEGNEIVRSDEPSNNIDSECPNGECCI